MALKLEKYIKDTDGKETEMHVSSVNLEKRQFEFIRAKNLNLSKIVRDVLDELIKESNLKRR